MAGQSAYFLHDAVSEQGQKLGYAYQYAHTPSLYRREQIRAFQAYRVGDRGAEKTGTKKVHMKAYV